MIICENYDEAVIYQFRMKHGHGFHGRTVSCSASESFTLYASLLNLYEQVSRFAKLSCPMLSEGLRLAHASPVGIQFGLQQFSGRIY